MREFCRRRPAEAEWRLAFPDRPGPEVREFLVAFTVAFGIGQKHWRVFRPDDRLYTVYRALNPAPWNMQADSCEYEWFDSLLTRKYRLKLDSLLSESTTLGEVFKHANMA